MNYALVALVIAAMGLALTFFVHSLQVAKRSGAVEERIAQHAARMVEDREATAKTLAEHKKELESRIVLTDAHRDQRIDRLEVRMDRLEQDIRGALEKTVADIREIVSETNARVDRLSERLSRREE